MKRLIPAAGYLRRSTNKQEKSLGDQRREIEKYAADHVDSVAQAGPPIKRIKVAVRDWLSHTLRCSC